MVFAIGPAIVTNFAADEIAGGSKRLAVFIYPAWTMTNGRKVPGGDKVRLVPAPIGNVTPRSDANLTEDLSGQSRQGEIEVDTLVELGVADEDTQTSSAMILHRGYFYTLHILNDWHYAKAFHYIGRRLREESAV